MSWATCQLWKIQPSIRKMRSLISRSRYSEAFDSTHYLFFNRLLFLSGLNCLICQLTNSLRFYFCQNPGKRDARWFTDLEEGNGRMIDLILDQMWRILGWNEEWRQRIKWREAECRGNCYQLPSRRKVDGGRGKRWNTRKALGWQVTMLLPLVLTITLWAWRLLLLQL